MNWHTGLWRLWIATTVIWSAVVLVSGGFALSELPEDFYYSPSTNKLAIKRGDLPEWETLGDDKSSAWFAITENLSMRIPFERIATGAFDDLIPVRPAAKTIKPVTLAQFEAKGSLHIVLSSALLSRNSSTSEDWVSLSDPE